jgi:DNA-directed RNA polymerase specialized sigma24 family protein
MSKLKIHADQKYIDGLATNDSVIIQSIYKKFVPKVVFFVMNNSGDQEQARGIVQDVLILLFNQAKAQRLQLNCPFEAYFFLLCKRKWIKEFDKISNKGVTIHEDVVSINESALELIKQTEDFEQKQQLFDDKVAEEREAFKENLTQIAEEHFNAKPKVIGLKPWYIAVLASVAVLFGLFFFNYNQNPVFADYNHPQKAAFAERGSEGGPLKAAESNFNSKRYSLAIPNFEAVLAKGKTPEIQYYYGISLLEESQYLKAESVLNELKAGDSAYKEKAIWYLALSKLKQRDYDGCKALLQTISEDYENYDEVQLLLDDLE